MQQHDLKLDIASRLLSGIICQDRNRTLDDRIADIDHSLEVADELIRRSEGHTPPGCEHTLDPKPALKVREQVIEREPAPFPELLQAKRGHTTTRPGKGPTLH
jgi:hypothetical protein